MRLYQKLLLFMLAAALGPVVALGLSLLSSAEVELRARIGAQQTTAASAAAQMAARDIDEAVESLVRAAEPIRWKALTPDERAGALKLVSLQSRHFSAAALLDAAGAERAPLVSAVGEEGGASGQVGLTAEEYPAFRAAVPLGALAGAAPGAVAMSPAYARPRFGATAAALAMAIEGPSETWFLAVEVSFRVLQERAEELSRGGAGSLFLFDGDGRAVAGPSVSALLTKAEAGDKSIAPSPGGAAAFARYLAGGEPMLGAAARTPGRLGWTAVIRLPEAEAFAPVARMRQTVFLSVGGALLLLLIAVLSFAAGVRQAIQRVAKGARAMGRGDLSARIPVVGKDEMAGLAATFNAMGGELHAARKKLETWNEELQRKVEERTAELKAAQAQLLEAQKLAAIGQLGAGVAHEINNPLAGILGNAQLLMLDRPPDDRDTQILKKIEAQAKRAKEITSNLLRFSQQRPVPDLRKLDLNRVVAEALSLVESQIKSEGVAIATALAPNLPPVFGDPGHLTQVILNLVSNARTAMMKSPSKRLTLSTAVQGDLVVMRVADTGKGIPANLLSRIFEPFFTTKDIWSNVGLGLSVSFRIVTEHGGKISVETEEGKGSTFSVELLQATEARKGAMAAGGLGGN
jgi:signal transduction histidine kinase